VLSLIIHHRCPWVGHHRPGGRSFRVTFRSVIVCGRQVVVCVWCPSFLGVSWVVVVIGGFPRAVCRSWVPGSLCKWVLGLVCGCCHLLVGCWLESRLNVARSGATSAVWFLCEKRGGGGCYTAHLDVVSREGGCGLSLALNVIGSVIGCGATWAPASCVKKGEGREGGYLPRRYPSSIIDMCCNLAVVVCHVADGNVAPACCVNRGEGGQEGLHTWTNVDSDNDLRHHRLDDVACLLMCQVVTLSRRPW